MSTAVNNYLNTNWRFHFKQLEVGSVLVPGEIKADFLWRNPVQIQLSPNFHRQFQKKDEFTIKYHKTHQEERHHKPESTEEQTAESSCQTFRSGNLNAEYKIIMLDMFKNRLSFLEQFYNHSKIEWKMQRVPVYLLSSRVQPLPLSTPPTRVVRYH